MSHASRNNLLLSAFALEVKAQRNHLKISQEELAHRADVDRTFVARIELGQNQPALSVLFKLAQGLEMTADALVAHTAKRYKALQRAQKNLATNPDHTAV